jgi:hypothetical protein
VAGQRANRAVASLVEAARNPPGDERPPCSQTIQKLTETLDAVHSDPETRTLVEEGRLDRERRGAALGLAELAAGRKRKGAKRTRGRAQDELKREHEMFTEGLEGVPRGIRDLRRIRGSESGWHDHLPALYSFLTFAHHANLNLRDREPLLAAMADDITWDGEPIAGLGSDDSKFLDNLEAEGLDRG